MVMTILSEERKVRRLKRDLVTQVYVRSGPFWEEIRKRRVIFNVEVKVQLPPHRLSPPRASLSIPKEDPRRQQDLKELRARLWKWRRAWSISVRTAWQAVIPPYYWQASNWDMFAAACILYDSPELQIDAFAEYGGLSPEGLPSIVWEKNAGEVSEAWEELFRGVIDELGRRYFALDGQDVWQLVSNIYSDTSLQQKFDKRLEAAGMIPAKPDKGFGGRPPMDKAIAIKCAALYHDHNSRKPEDLRIKDWTYEKLAKNVIFPDPNYIQPRKNPKRVGEEHVKLGEELRKERRKK